MIFAFIKSGHFMPNSDTQRNIIETGNEAAKWNSAIFNFISDYTFPFVRCHKVFGCHSKQYC